MTLNKLNFHLLTVLGLSHESAEIVMDRIGELEAQLATTTDVLTKAKAWIDEAKPLLEKGGEAERELAREKEARHQVETKLNDALAELYRYQCIERGETPPP